MSLPFPDYRSSSGSPVLARSSSRSGVLASSVLRRYLALGDLRRENCCPPEGSALVLSASLSETSCEGASPSSGTLLRLERQKPPSRTSDPSLPCSSSCSPFGAFPGSRKSSPLEFSPAKAIAVFFERAERRSARCGETFRIRGVSDDGSSGVGASGDGFLGSGASGALVTGSSALRANAFRAVQSGSRPERSSLGGFSVPRLGRACVMVIRGFYSCCCTSKKHSEMHVVVYTLQNMGLYTPFSLQCIVSDTIGLP